MPRVWLPLEHIDTNSCFLWAGYRRRPLRRKRPRTFRLRKYRSKRTKEMRRRLNHLVCFACHGGKAAIFCETCSKYHCYRCCYRDFDVCSNCVLQHFSFLLRLQDPHRTLAMDMQLSRRECTRVLVHLAPFLSKCTCCLTTGLHKLCVACLSETCDACLEPESFVCVDCLPADLACFYCNNYNVCGSCLLCNSTCCAQCMATIDTCMPCQHSSEN